MKVKIIAEAGVNHNANMDVALQMVGVAHDAGADIVKFQSAIPEEVVTRYAGKAAYQLSTTNPDESQLEMTKKIHLPLVDFHKIEAECKKIGIDFLTTFFGPESAKFIHKMNPRLYKIPSGEITNLPYLRDIGSKNKNIILSTGMARLGEIEAAL